MKAIKRRTVETWRLTLVLDDGGTVSSPGVLCRSVTLETADLF